jgi:hypothetical protein
MSAVIEDRPPSFSAWTGSRGRVAMIVAVGLLLVFAGYVLGRHREATHSVSGPAQVGDRVVTMTGPDGTAYGFSESIPWLDATGSWHEGGWPECLGSARALDSVTFGVTRVDYPDASSADQVVYVDCRT